jgi:uncharacterized membrane protein
MLVSITVSCIDFSVFFLLLNGKKQMRECFLLTSMTSTSPAAGYTREEDRAIHGIVSPSSEAQVNQDSARRNLSTFMSSALGRLKGFRNVEEREANCGSFAVSVVMLGVFSTLLACFAAISLPVTTRRAHNARDYFAWVELSLGILGSMTAYGTWSSRWSSYSLSPCKRVMIAVIVLSIFMLLLVQGAGLFTGSLETMVAVGLQVGMCGAGFSVLATSRGRLSRLVTAINGDGGSV